MGSGLDHLFAAPCQHNCDLDNEKLHNITVGFCNQDDLVIPCEHYENALNSFMLFYNSSKRKLV